MLHRLLKTNNILWLIPLFLLLVDKFFVVKIFVVIEDTIQNAFKKNNLIVVVFLPSQKIDAVFYIIKIIIISIGQKKYFSFYLDDKTNNNMWMLSNHKEELVNKGKTERRWQPYRNWISMLQQLINNIFVHL